MSNDSKTDQFAARLLETATLAERILPPEEVCVALLSCWTNYALRRGTSVEVIKVLRLTADALAADDAMRGRPN